MLHENLSEIIRNAELRSQQSLNEFETAKKMNTIPWISVTQALPKNDFIMPRAQRRQYLIKLLPDGYIAVAVFGYAGHHWWADSFGRLLTPD